MSEEQLRGVFGILVTPFLQSGEVDWGAFDQELAFCLQMNIQGLVVGGVASEFFALTIDERVEQVRRVLNLARGRYPVIVGVSAPHLRIAEELVDNAVREGATALLAMPPWLSHPYHPLASEGRAHFEALASRAGSIPLVLQNTGHIGGVTLTPSQIYDLVQAVPTIRYVKEEVGPSPQRIVEVLKLVGPLGVALIGGSGGTYVLSEYARGCVAWMPACEFADVLARIVDYLSRKESSEAQSLYHALLPGLVMENVWGMMWAKAVLGRRGVPMEVSTRIPVAAWGPSEAEDLDRLWPDLERVFASIQR